MFDDESFDDLLLLLISPLPNEEPLLLVDTVVGLVANRRIFDDVVTAGNELAELSLIVEAESRSTLERILDCSDGLRNNELEPPLSDNRPYSPNLRSDKEDDDEGGISERAGETRRLLLLLLLAFELNESPPSDFLRIDTTASSPDDSPNRL